MKLWPWVLAAFMLLAGFNAEAARFGGGRSFGKQSSNVTQRQVAPKPPAAAGAVFRASNAALLRSQGRAEASLPTFSGR